MKRCFVAGMLTVISILCGCVPLSQPRYFTLGAQKLDRIAGAPVCPPLLIGPVRIPRSIDREELAHLGPNHEVQYANSQRWAEPIADLLTHALASNLRDLLGCDDVLFFPHTRQSPERQQIEFEFLSFIVNESDQAELNVLWRVLATDDRSGDPPMQRFSVEIPVAGSGREAEITALSQALAQFGQEIAEHLKKAPAPTRDTPIDSRRLSAE